MPKKIIEAEIKTSSGTEIKLKGNTDDVAKVVGLFADQKTDKNKLEIEREISGLDKNIFDVEDGKVTLIVKNIPGKNKKEKTINAAFLYLYGVYKQNKTNKAPKKEIIEICKDYGCFDSSNFSSHIKSETRLRKKNINIKITPPGINRAEELIREINESKNK